MRQHSAHLFPTPEGITLAGVIIAKRNRDGTFAISGREKQIHAQLQAAYGKSVSPDALRYIKRGAELLAQVTNEELENAAYPYSRNSYVKPHSSNDVPVMAKSLMMFALTGLNDMENVAEGKARLEKMQRTLQCEALLKTYGLPTWAELTKDDDDEGDDDEGDGDESDDGSNSSNAGDSGGYSESGNGHYNPDEPRIPAGQPGGGQWTTGGGTSTDSGSITADEIRAALTEGLDYPLPIPQGTQAADSGQIKTGDNDAAASTDMTPSGPIQIIHGVPADAVYYHTGTDESPFWAPPAADWSAVYAAGQANSWPAFNPFAAQAAIAQYGNFDFQRDSSTNTFMRAYTNASNYAVGVYMNGAGSSYSGAFEAWLAYSGIKSSNTWSSDQWFWIQKGWTDAESGKLAVAQ